MPLLVLLVLFVIPLPLMAEEMEIVELRHRLVDDVLPVLQPLLEPNGVMTGMGNQLIVRTSRRNLEEIRRVLAVVDQPPRRLVIRVSQSRSQRGQDSALALSAQGRGMAASEPGGTRLTVRGEAHTGALRDQIDQSVQVLDGSPAVIHVGRSLAVPMRRVAVTAQRIEVTERVEYVDIGQGFYATPWLNGNQVTVEISPYSEELSPHNGDELHGRRLSTTVAGQLGDWIELGGSSGQRLATQGGIASRSAGELSDQQSIWLRVDEIP